MENYEFFNVIKEETAGRLEGLAEVVDMEVKKNNGVVLHALSIRSEDTNVAPSIYLDGYYEEYLEGRKIESIVHDVMEMYGCCKQNRNVDFDFLDYYEEVKGRIGMKIIDPKRNKEMLETVPWKQFLDLAIVFYILMDDPFMGKGSVIVSNSMVETWGVEVDDLYEVAHKNIKDISPITINHIFSVMSDLIVKDSEDDDFWKDLDERQTPMYVVSNKEQFFGATALLYPEELGNFADELERDLIILPCSIHELIVLPNDEIDTDSLKEMVVSVNETQLERQMILSDSVYFFDRENRSVKRIA